MLAADLGVGRDTVKQLGKWLATIGYKRGVTPWFLFVAHFRYD